VSAFPAPTHTPSRSRPWCCFRSGHRAYAVDLKSVVEVVETDGLVRLPHGPKSILGLAAFRRDVIPVVQFGHAGDDPAPRGRIDVLILRTEQGFWGLHIHRSGTVVVEDYVEEDPALDPDVPRKAPVLIGTLRKGDMVCSVIDTESTWLRLRTAIESDYRAPLASPAGVALDPATASREGIDPGGGG